MRQRYSIGQRRKSALEPEREHCTDSAEADEADE
jgi:hypothetical protein